MKSKLPKSIIISSKPGQLGNMLFLFSNLIAFGKEKNIIIEAPAFHEYAHYFNSTSKSLIPSYPSVRSIFISHRLRNIIYRLTKLFFKITDVLKLNNRFFSTLSIEWDEIFNLEDEKKIEQLNSKYLFIQGWLFRSRTLLTKHKKVIINFFLPADIHMQRVNKLLDTTYEIIIGIHIRHGDYKNFEGGKYYYTLMQYSSIMYKALTLFPQQKVAFLICSNTKEDLTGFEGLSIIRGTNHELEDLYSFAKCTYLIGPPSTYTMWASFYGDVPLYQVHDPESPFTLEDFRIIVS